MPYTKLIDQYLQKPTGCRFVESFAAMSETMEFLTELEKIQLQGLNHFCYEHAVSRAHVSIKLPSEHLFAVVHQPQQDTFETKTLSYRCTG